MEARSILIDLQSHQARKLYALYQRRVEICLTHPPPADWDGVASFSTK